MQEVESFLQDLSEELRIEKLTSIVERQQQVIDSLDVDIKVLDLKEKK